MSTFPPPRVDITSKTWPSLPTCCYVDGEGGEHLGRASAAPRARPSAPRGSVRPAEMTAGPGFLLAGRQELSESDVVCRL